MGSRRAARGQGLPLPLLGSPTASAQQDLRGRAQAGLLTVVRSDTAARDSPHAAAEPGVHSDPPRSCCLHLKGGTGNRDVPRCHHPPATLGTRRSGGSTRDLSGLVSSPSPRLFTCKQKQTVTASANSARAVGPSAQSGHPESPSQRPGSGRRVSPGAGHKLLLLPDHKLPLLCQTSPISHYLFRTAATAAAESRGAVSGRGAWLPPDAAPQEMVVERR